MTGLLHENEFSRKSFVKGGGALIVGFSLFGSSLAGRAQAAEVPQLAPASPFASNGPYDQYAIDSWIVINADNTASIRSGGVFQGTGSETGLLMIAGEELNMNLSQLIFANADTDVTPATGIKSASNTIIDAGTGVRAAAASAAQVLLGLASTKLGVPVASLSVSGGVVSGGGSTVTYGELLGGQMFNVEMPASYNMQATPGANYSFTGGITPGVSPAKSPALYTLVGTSPPRIDIPAIVTGATTYVQNVHVPAMLHGRVVRPRGQTMYGFGAPVLSVDESSIAHIPGARVLQTGNFLGVVAPHEYDAIEAAGLLKVTWAAPPAVLPGSGNEFEGMRALDNAGKSVQSYSNLAGNVDAALATAAHSVAETYGWHTNNHTPIGPQCTVADVTPQGARILTWTQDVYKTRFLVAQVLGLPQNQVRVTHYPGGGTYGYNQYADVALSAAVMSKLVGAPVRVQLMRWDEIGWDNTPPGTLMDARAGIDANGNIVGFDFTQFYPQYRGEANQTTAQLTGTIAVAPSASGGSHAPSAIYNIPNTRYLLKSLPLVGNWIKADWMRHGATPHVNFATEQVIDELAHAAGMDPVVFRTQNVNPVASASLLAVLNAATQTASWQPKVAASQLSDANIVTGRGVAWNGSNTDAAMKTAAIADISVNKKTGKITVKHVYQAFSAGLAIYPGGIENQMVGGITQILSRALVEELRYNHTNVTSVDFVTYPIMRFMDAPKITTIVVQRYQVVPQGVGEPVTGVAPAAVANAFFDATGVRLRTAPMTPARVRAALAAGGAGVAGVA